MSSMYDIDKIISAKKKQRVFDALSLSAKRFVRQHGGNEERVLNKLIDLYRAGEIYLNLEEIEKESSLELIGGKDSIIVLPSNKGAFKF